MKPYGLVYLTTNLKNGMMYIGQTHYREVMRDTYFGSGKAIKRAVKKNGITAFKRETLFEAFTAEDLDWAERHFIAEHDAVRSRRFYNITPGGRASLGFTGKKHTAERNAALSAKMIGHGVTDAVRTSAANIGRKHGAVNGARPLICPHCGKQGKGFGMTRWHMNNCAHRSLPPIMVSKIAA